MAKQERAVRTRNQLIASAADTFRRCGFAEASLTVIRDDACVSSGALYFHFANKAALASAVVDEAARILRAAARHMRHRPAPALQHLIDVTHGLAALLCENVVAQAGFQLSRTGYGGPGPTLLQEWRECVTAMLAEAHHQGTLRRDVAPQDVSAMIVAMAVGFESLSREDQSWLREPAITAFWKLQLPWLAAPQALDGLMPEGSESTLSSLRRLLQLPRV
ncbi:ScbR family autoregulator-binding transcription factor [Streptomyces sp. NPDC001315]|uniref:ScbR family autoregulator-binding transcription factor n=1 Tax=Streptomyces sp. NPDC001315 TaxID=3364562 RepID=UPI0036B26940